MRRVLFILLPVLGTLILLLAADSVFRPWLENWGLEKLRTYSARQGPVSVDAEELEIRLLPPRVELRGLTAEPKAGQLPWLRAARVGSVRLRLDAFDLMVGRLELASLRIQGTRLDVDLDPLLDDDAPPSEIPTAEIFRWLEKIPLRRLILDETKLDLTSTKRKASASVDLTRLEAVNKIRNIELAADAPLLKISAGPIDAFSVAAGGDFVIDPAKLSIRRLELWRQNMRLELRGELDDLPSIALSPKARLNIHTDLDLSDVHTLLSELWPARGLPKLSGRTEARAELQWQGADRLISRLQVQTKDVKVAQIEVGDASLQGTLTPKELALDEIQLRHPSGRVTVKKSRLGLRPPFAFETELDVRGLDLQALFQSMDLREIPIETTLSGRLPCQGSLQPLGVRCDVTAQSDRIVVRTDNRPDEDVIVALKDLEAQGNVSADAEGVTFQSRLRVGGSHGEAKGSVRFKDGFRIDFKTPEIRALDVEDLAGLKLEGRMAIEGFTEGDSDAAIFDLKVSARDFFFENYRLGQVDGIVKYRSGHLLFDNLVASLPRSRATGGLDVDLRGKKIAGLFEAGTLDLGDVALVFERLVQLPFEVQAPGRARVQFSGPLNFWKLSYSLDTNFRNGRIQGDSFESLELKASAVDGDMKVEKALLRKNNSTLVMRGGITPEPSFGLMLEVNGLRLEESELINRVRSNLSGLLGMTAEIRGPVTAPDLYVRGTLSDIIIDEQEIPSSFFNFHLNKDLIEGESTLFGNKIQSEFVWPLRAGAGALRLRLKTTDWNFTSLLSLVGASSLQNEYESRLSAEVDLKSDSGALEKSDGHITFQQIHLKRGALSLRSPRAQRIDLSGGTISMKDFFLEGERGTGIHLQGDQFRLDRLNVQVQANSDLRLLHMFLPFLEDLGGAFKVSATVTGELFKPLVLGNASVREAFVKIKGFPHPLEKLNTEVVFSQSRVMVQSLKGQLGGGQVTGEGLVQINGYGDVPTQIRARAEGLSLTVPDKVRTNGNADLVFSGKWFPFVLSGTYNVQSALVEKEFGGENSSLAPKTSSYLPKILRQANFDPVLLDLNVHLERNVMVRNSQMEGEVTGHLQVKGPPQDPILLGRIVIEKGTKIIVKDKAFELLTGIVNFNNPEEVNPDLYISAQMRMDEYDINVLVQGPSKAPGIRLTSIPPLPEPDIISLLALGVTSTNLDQRVTSSKQAEQLGYEALGIGLQRTGVKKGLESTLGVNVQISSVYDTTRSVSVPKISFTKRLGSRLNAVVSRPLGSDAENTQEVKLQYQINNSVSAIGSYEERESQTTSLQERSAAKTNIFGLDLEFKREFK